MSDNRVNSKLDSSFISKKSQIFFTGLANKTRDTAMNAHYKNNVSNRGIIGNCSLITSCEWPNLDHSKTYREVVENIKLEANNIEGYKPPIEKQKKIKPSTIYEEIGRAHV